MRILIVDDSDAMRTFLRNLAHDLEHETFESSNGAEAVAAYRNYHPDLVLMDVRMPVMDGLEATELITRSDSAARVAIVTDYDETEFRERAAAAGATQYFLKDDLSSLLSYISVQ